MAKRGSRIVGKGATGMNQAERREFLICALLRERGEAGDYAIPADASGQRDMLCALFNVRDPRPVDDVVLRVQDEYLQERAREKGIVDFRVEAPRAVSLGELGAREDGRAALSDAADGAAAPTFGSFRKSADGLCLWQGDITRLKIDAIVNAANSALLGCFRPGHYCIDNAIHTFAGMQLRLECARIMRAQGTPEPTGYAKVTSAYNLPSSYIVHTVGPIVNGGRPSECDCELLAQSYRSCLDAARARGCASIALCCISTGVFGFPQKAAARIAIEEVRAWRAEHGKGLDVLFNVFLDSDCEIYEHLLAGK